MSLSRATALVKFGGSLVRNVTLGRNLRPNALCVDHGQRRSIGSISAFDSIIFRNLFGTDEIRNVSKQSPMR
jgi:hypothetical protein